MNDLLAVAAQNTIAAAILGVLVYGLTRLWRRPPVAYFLWLLVLAKLVAPPVLSPDWLQWNAAISAHASHDPEMLESNPAAFIDFGNAPKGKEAASEVLPIPPQASTPIPAQPGTTARLTTTVLFEMGRDWFWFYGYRYHAVVFFAWMLGVGVCGAVILCRIARFNGVLNGALRAPQPLQTIAAELAQALGLSRVPDLLLVAGCSVPLVWCFSRRATIILPMRLVQELNDRQLSMVLAHEMAHLRRRDHWVRVLEAFISTLYWWNPQVRWIRRQLHLNEELCCDAWVEWLFPGCEKPYAEVLFTVATFAGDQHERTPMFASAFLDTGTLKGRIETILTRRLSRQVRWPTGLALTAVALLLLPSYLRSEEPAVTEPHGLKSVEKKTESGKGTIVGRVTVDGTDEPVSGALISAMLGLGAKRNYELVSGKSVADGRYSIDVPFGNAGLWPWTFQWPPGYWSTDQPAYVATSAAEPVATKNYALRYGPVWQILARDAASGQPISALQCTITATEGGPFERATATTNSDGMAVVTLPGFHGTFQFVLFNPNRRGQYELSTASLTIDTGFQVEQIADIVPGNQAREFRLKDKAGKVATLEGAEAKLVAGKVLIEFGVTSTTSDGTAVVRGSVVDRSGQPITGALVEAAQTSSNGSGFITGISATTNADGSFEIKNPGIRAGGQISLVVTKDGYGGIETPAHPLAKDRATSLDFGQLTLLPGKSIRVRVLDSGRKPAVGALVQPLGGYAGIIQGGATDEKGEYVIRNLPSGMVKVSATFGDAHGSAPAYPTDDPATITLYLKPTPKRVQNNPADQPRPLDLGTPAPDLDIAAWLDGQPRSLANYRGKVVVLDFWGIWCGPCLSMLPMMKNLEASYKDRDVVFLSVHTAGTEIEQIREFERQSNFSFATALDAGDDVVEGATSKKYGVRGYPTVYIIGRDGRIAWRNVLVSPQNHLEDMQRAAKALSIPWPIDEAQPKEDLAAKMNQIREFLFAEAIDQVLATQ